MRERQTALGLGGNILLAIVVVAAMRAIVFGDETSGGWWVQRIIAGSWLAISMTASRYSRLLTERRLPPPHAIGVGGLQLVLMAWITLTAPNLKNSLLLVVIGACGLALPGAYLVVMGTRAATMEPLR
jgi:hypothetical protein